MAVSDSEGIEQSSTIKIQNGPEEPPQTDEDMVDDNQLEEDDDEEEYEIEAILEARRDHFGANKIGYFVKWKNYDEEHNSWVSQDDAGNAQELISQYWQEKKKKTAKRDTGYSKPRQTKPSTSVSTSRQRQSEGADRDNGDFVSVIGAKKRARNAKSSSKAVDEDESIVESEDETTVKRRKRATHGKARETPEEDLYVGTMSEYMAMESWEGIVQRVETIERKDNILMVYFLLNSGERIKENSKLCGQKFPQKMLRFYESNLKWREASTEQD